MRLKDKCSVWEREQVAKVKRRHFILKRCWIDLPEITDAGNLIAGDFKLLIFCYNLII